jgi:ABC-2 type transport system ATP-binding protein
MNAPLSPSQASNQRETRAGAPALVAQHLRKAFRRKDEATVQALDGVSFEARYGELTALVGPDGAGKTTLMRLAAGLLHADGGSLTVLGLDVAAEPQQVQDRISYMPQRFGLYEDLSVQENLDLYADLHGVTAAERAQRYPALIEMTALGAFKPRLAGQLSGGMKQKLGLACTLVRSPELLLLDEPTVGVDPLSRRELWEIVRRLVADQGLTVLLSTAYLDEAERCSRVIMLHQGKVLSRGSPQQVAALADGRCFVATPSAQQSPRSLQARLLDQPEVIDAVPDGGRVRFVLGAAAAQAAAAVGGAAASGAGGAVSIDGALHGLAVKPVPPRFEDGFMMLLRTSADHEHLQAISITRPVAGQADDAVVRVQQLVRKFGAFTAVDHISFEVRRGEIFGLLGPNGAGKTTTFRMLCGLLAPSGGQLRVAGADVRDAPASARARLGYVAQKFSLYGPLSVLENLEFFASAYGLRGERRRTRIAWATQQFELGAHLRAVSSQLPGGFQQRLAMAAALLHEPEILFLDEPTSGADPLARRAFWRRITALAQQGVTIIVTTHFMQEAEYCDHIAIMDSGQVLSQGSPAEVRERARTEAQPEPSMEDAFIAVVEQARARPGTRGAAPPVAA